MPAAAPHTVLLVDDDPTWRLLLSISLRDAGFVVRTAASSEDAKSLLESLVPQALVVDLVQPGLDGMALLEWCASHGGCPPRLALSAQRSEDLLERCAGLGVTEVLGKPLRARDFTAHVRRVCEAVG